MTLKFRPLKNLFILYCALNANGYDKENAPAMHPVRLKVREFLKGQKFTRFDFKWNPYQYTKQVLLSADLSEYLKKFAVEAKLETIWPLVERETKSILNTYQAEVVQMIDNLKTLIDLEEPSAKIVVCVNLLESFYRGFSISNPDTTYLITGPSDKINLRNILHELLHAYLKKNEIKLTVDPKIYQQIAEELKANYPLETIAEESLVRALVVYLGQKLKIEKSELSDQDKKLIFPEIYLKKLIDLNPAKITTETLTKL